MKYYLVAGEASGDLHASNLIKGLAKNDDQAIFRGWGGDQMQEAGCEIVRHYKETAIMGFLTVVKNLNVIKRNIQDCCDDLLQWNPDVVILVDYAGFNLRIAEFAHKRGIKVFYYISPKIWAWNSSRVEKFKKYVDKMYVIFPFEREFFSQYNYPVHYEGNPLVDAIDHRLKSIDEDVTFRKKNNLSDKPIIALVAGSRKQELKHVLPKMLEMIDLYPEYQFVIAGAPSMSPEDYKLYIQRYNVQVIYDQTYTLIKHAYAALVTSGTATLETALIGTPQVVCYSGEGGILSYYLFKWFVKVDYISLVNLIANKEVVKELLMHKLNKENLSKELEMILHDQNYRENMLAAYRKISNQLGDVGASERFAKQMIKDLS